MIKVILFDIDNTLLSFDGYVKEAMRSGFEEFDLGVVYDDEAFSVFTRINGELWRLIEKGELDLEGLKRYAGT